MVYHKGYFSAQLCSTDTFIGIGHETSILNLRFSVNGWLFPLPIKL